MFGILESLYTRLHLSFTNCVVVVYNLHFQVQVAIDEDLSYEMIPDSTPVYLPVHLYLSIETESVVKRGRQGGKAERGDWAYTNLLQTLNSLPMTLPHTHPLLPHQPHPGRGSGVPL